MYRGDVLYTLLGVLAVAMVASTNSHRRGGDVPRRRGASLTSDSTFTRSSRAIIISLRRKSVSRDREALVAVQIGNLRRP